MILVLIETDADGLSVTSAETLTFARRMAEGSGRGPVEAVLARPADDAEQQALSSQLGTLGVARLHVADDDRLTVYGAAAWAAAMQAAGAGSGADTVLAAGTPRGSEVLAHVATRLGVAMAANVVSVDSAEPLQVSRQVMGGSVLEEMALTDATAVLTVAGHATDPEPAAEATTPQISTYQPGLTDADLVGQVRRTHAAQGEDTAALTKARVVVGAGRGVGSADGFGEVLELTELLGGSLGVSRVVTNLGWRPHHEQVGQTGSRISPDVYLACGISGAIQHWAGCQSAKTIIAVNTDPDAPMVTKADYAVIGDLHEVIAAVNDEIRARRS